MLLHKPEISLFPDVIINIIVVSAGIRAPVQLALVPEWIKTSAVIIQGHLEINGCFGASNDQLVVGGFKIGRTPGKPDLVAWRKSRERADIKTALARLSNQGRFIYLCGSEIEMNGVPKGI